MIKHILFHIIPQCEYDHTSEMNVKYHLSSKSVNRQPQSNPVYPLHHLFAHHCPSSLDLSHDHLSSSQCLLLKSRKAHLFISFLCANKRPTVHVCDFILLIWNETPHVYHLFSFIFFLSFLHLSCVFVCVYMCMHVFCVCVYVCVSVVIAQIYGVQAQATRQSSGTLQACTDTLTTAGEYTHTHSNTQ